MNSNLEEFNRLALNSFDPDDSDEPNLRQILVRGFLLLGNTLERIAVNQLLDVEIPEPDFDHLNQGCTIAAIEFIKLINELEQKLLEAAAVSTLSSSGKLSKPETKAVGAICENIKKMIALISLDPDKQKSLIQELTALTSPFQDTPEAFGKRLLEVEKFRIKVLRLLLSNACQGTSSSNV